MDPRKAFLHKRVVVAKEAEGEEKEEEGVEVDGVHF